LTALYPFLTQMFGRGLQHETAGDVPQERAGMLPLASWGDGPAFGLPGMAIQAREAWNRFASGQNPQPGDEVLAGLAMTGAGAFGLGGRAVSRGSVAGAERAEASSGLLSIGAEAGSAPVTARVYRGTGVPGAENGWAYFASDNPSVAATYADGPAPAIIPGDMTLRNPLVIDAAGANYDNIPGHGLMYNAVEAAKKGGNDGLVIRNIVDPMKGYDGPPATTYAALKPGTVKSATTGETLFSNPKEAAPAGMLAMDAASRMERAKAQGYTIDAYKGGYPYKPESGPVTDWKGNVIRETPLEPLTEFNRRPERNWAGFFSDQADVANRFADHRFHDSPAVWKTKLKFENPLVIDAENNFAAAFQFDGIARRDGTSDKMQQFFSAFDEGSPYDGVILKNTKDEGTVYVPRNPNQVRSVNAAFDPAKASSGDILAANPPDAAPVGVLPSMANAGERQTVRGYHGTDGELVGGRFDANRSKRGPGVYFASHPDEALGFTGDAAPNIIPGDISFAKPLVVQAGADDPSQFWRRNASPLLERVKSGGHDGVIVKSDPYDSGHPNEIYVALQPGTVKSPYSGEQLFSNPRDAAPAGLLATGEGENSQQDFMLELLRRHGFLR
jgi:hypothetical protein